MSVPVYFLRSTLTFCTASLAISPSFPVAMILPSSLLWAGAASAAIGSMIPLRSPIIARPLTLPTSPPSDLKTLYFFFCTMYLSAICCSRVLESFLASTTSSGSTISAPLLFAMSPAALTRPPSSRSLSVRESFLPALLWASLIISFMASLLKWGILPSFSTSCATNWTSLSLFSGVSGIESFMKTSYPYPLILDLRAGCIPSSTWRFPEATRTKSQGTACERTIAPLLVSL